MDVQKVKNFTHCCIEGYTCAALFKSSFPNCEFKYETCTPNDWMKRVTTFVKSEKRGEKAFIFITDLNIPEAKKNEPEVQEFLDLIGKRGNVFLIDHHDTAGWLVEDNRINVHVDPAAKSASHIVLDTLKYNLLTEEGRKKENLVGLQEFPLELKKCLTADYGKLNDLNLVVKVMDVIDCGEDGHEDVLFVFHNNKKKFFENVAKNRSVETSPEQKKESKLFLAQKKRKIKDFIAKASKSNSNITQIDKDENGFTRVRVICPGDKDVLACDIAKELNKLNVRCDYLEVFRICEEKKNGEIPRPLKKLSFFMASSKKRNRINSVLINRTNSVYFLTIF